MNAVKNTILRVPYDVPNPGGGLDTLGIPTEIALNKSPDSLNTLCLHGRIRTRPGYRLAIPTVLPAPPNFIGYNTIYSSRPIAAVALDDIYAYNAVGATWVALTATLTGSGPYAPQSAEWFVAPSRYLWTNGLDGIIEWDGNIANPCAAMSLLLGAPISAALMCVWADRLWLAYIETAPAVWNTMRVMWSNYRAYTDFTNGSWGFDDLLDDFTPATGMKALGKSLLVYKQGKIFSYSQGGYPIYFPRQTVCTDKGSASPDSIQLIEGGHAFLGGNIENVYWITTGQQNPTPIGDPIKKYLNEIDPTLAKYCTSYHDKTNKLYWLFTTYKKGFIWNYQDNTWDRFELHDSIAGTGGLTQPATVCNMTVSQTTAPTWDEDTQPWYMDDETWDATRPATAEAMCLGTGKYVVKVDFAEVLDWDTLIESHYQSKVFYFGGDNAKMDAVDVHLKGVIDITAQFANSDDSIDYVEQIQTDVGAAYPLMGGNRVSFSGTGRTIGLKFSNDTSHLPFVISRYLIRVLPRGEVWRVNL